MIDRLSFASAPALFAALWLCGGILIGSKYWTGPGLLIVAVLLLGFLTAMAASRAPRFALPALAATWILLGAFLIETEPAPSQQTPLGLMAEAGGRHSIEAVIARTTAVRLSDRGEQSESIDVRMLMVDGQSMGGGLRATIYGPQTFPLPCGARIQANVEMHAPERYLDPGVWDATEWLRLQGIEAIGSAKSSSIAMASGRPHATFTCWLHGLQQSGSERLLNFAGSSMQSRLPRWMRISTADAGMLSAMILGDRTYLNHEERVGFERTGSFHLLVVSGMHLAIFASCIFALTATLRLGRAWSTVLTIACSLAYALLAGFGEPMQRSFWMVTLYLVARLIFRQKNSLNAIGFAALCLLALDPRSLSGASLQMTLLSVIVVGGIVVPIAEHTFRPYLEGTRSLSLKAIDPSLPPKIAQFRVTLRLIASHLEPFFGRRFAYFFPPASARSALRVFELLLVSGLIELAMSLPMAVYFHRITALGLPVNLLIIPLIGLVLPSAFLTFVTLLVWPVPAIVPAIVTAAALHTIQMVVGLFSTSGAGDIRIPGPGAAVTAVSILLIGVSVWAARNSRFPVAAPMVALALSAAIVFYPRKLVYHPGVLEVIAIDVGQGDSLLLISPEGKTLLIDAGGPIGGNLQTSSSNFEIGEEVISPVLWSRNIRRLDAVALTHAHSDHMGGMPTVLRNFRPRVLWIGTNPEIPAYEALLNEARRLGIPIEAMAAGSAFAFGGTQVNVLAPAVDYLPGEAASNDDSLVLHIAYGKTSALLEGDAEAASERQMLGEPLRADLLKVGHHGSRTSTIPPFLAAVQPSYAVISVARHNPFGHPKPEILERLQQRHIRTFRTDAIGATSFYLNGTTVTAEPLPLH